MKIRPIYYFLMYLQDLVLRRSFFEAVNLLYSSQSWSIDKRQIHQGSRLNVILSNAKTNVPYYQDLLGDYDVDNPDYFYNINYLNRLPILTKVIIQQHHDELKNIEFSKFHPRVQRTGGTTGEPTLFFHDQKKLDYTRAALMRSFYWADYPLRKKCLKTGAGQHEVTINKGKKGALKNFLFNRCFVDGSNLTDSQMDRIINKLLSGKFKVLWGYSSLINEIAQEAIQRNLSINLDSIITSSEMLFPAQRQAIEQAFNAPVYDNYSSREFAIAAECNQHNGLHVNDELLFVEILNDQNNRVTANEVGRVIITDLFNLSFPFIRYEIGDLAEWGNEIKCSCGVGSKKFARIVGRKSEIIRLGLDVRIPPTFFPDYFKIYDHISDFMIEIMDNDSICVDVVVKNHPIDNKAENSKIKNDLCRHFPGISFQIRETEEIARTQGGKRQFIIDHRSTPQ